MTDPAKMQLGHTIPLVIDPHSKADRIECTACNEADGGHLAHTKGQ